MRAIGENILSKIQITDEQSDACPQCNGTGWELVEGRGVREAIEAKGGEVIYLPPYSPDWNPIEKCWSKLKTALRAVGARTREALEEAIGQVIKTISATDALAWFAHCGYVVN